MVGDQERVEGREKTLLKTQEDHVLSREHRGPGKPMLDFTPTFPTTLKTQCEVDGNNGSTSRGKGGPANC